MGIIKNNAVVVLADTTDTEIVFGDETFAYFPRPFQEVVIRTAADNSGTIQFSVGEAITADHEAVGPGETRIITIANGSRNLHAKGSANNQEFTASV